MPYRHRLDGWMDGSDGQIPHLPQLFPNWCMQKKTKNKTENKTYSTTKMGIFFLILSSLHQGRIWKYDGLPTQTNVHSHKRAIITLSLHMRESSGKPRDAAERGVNRKLVIHILVAKRLPHTN